ncbi:unnamed protein product [Spirodela intermedia]|uniref:B box-type domain-containing protein n=1 Tax=Spirodela intermedia TaxID=51605 RepID=A0A7I8IIL4_SPIIN|nr:unnamed protein product [Spirodela intermedia]CAA6657566.1 unnamed protein product [Spirodela intermedia]
MESRWQGPLWVFSLLSGKFFVPCSSHEDVKKNEKNVFCVDCCAPICLHCRRHLHRAHRLLQVRRYVYQEVVQVEDCEELFDCSSIQSYITNKAKVVFLNQRPQSRPLKSSGSWCISCQRNLQRPYHFCSLGCKVFHHSFESFLQNSGGVLGAVRGPLGLPGPAVEGEQMTPSGVLGGGACLRASSGSSGVWGRGGPSATPRTAPPQPRAPSPGRRSGRGVLLLQPLSSLREEAIYHVHPENPPSPSSRRKGAPSRSPFF